jgi:hypothetical protein
LVDWDPRSAEGNLSGLDGTIQIRCENRDKIVPSSALAEFSRSLLALFRQPAGEPTRGNAPLVVDAPRVGLKYDLDAQYDASASAFYHFGLSH